jgi:hypothetical protein
MSQFSYRKPAFFCLVLFVCVLFFSSIVSAQKVRLRAQIAPECAALGNARAKYADIYADGNIAVQGSYNCRGAFIYDISDPTRRVCRAGIIRARTSSFSKQSSSAIAVISAAATAAACTSLI